MTQKQLAARLSISLDHLKAIENKQQTPSGDLLLHIIRELEIPADMIFYPEYRRDNAQLDKLRILLSRYNEKDIDTVIALLQYLLEHKPDGGELGAALHK